MWNSALQYSWAASTKGTSGPSLLHCFMLSIPKEVRHYQHISLRDARGGCEEGNSWGFRYKTQIPISTYVTFLTSVLYALLVASK